MAAARGEANQAGKEANVRSTCSAVVRLIAVLSLMMPFFASATVSPAFACSGGVPLPEARFVPGAPPEVSGIGPNSIALLGEVQDETSLPDSPTPMFLSTVRTVVPLDGEGVTAEVRVGPNGYGAPECSGGPRLFPGEKVALFLYPSPHWLLPEGEAAGSYGDWQSGQLGTPILFDGDDAYYLSWGRFAEQGGGTPGEQREYVGKSADVLELVLTYFGLTGAQRAEAVAFVLGTSTGGLISPPDTGDAGLASNKR